MKKIYVLALLTLVSIGFAQAQNNPLIKATPLTAQQTAEMDAIAKQRLPRAQACMEVKQNIVKLVLWDCGIEDNDTISINLNGQWVLHRFRLTNAKQEIEIKLAPGENQLMLLANNLGDIPDNTAAMAINQNGIEQKAVLSSNLLTSGTLRLLVTGTNPVANVMTGCPDDTQVYMDDENNYVRANPDLANPKFGYLYTGLQKYPYEPVRTLEMQGCTNVSQSEIMLYFWDCGVEDNDTVSVNVNGVWVVEKMRLAKAKQGIKVTLQPGSNYVVMYAHNLGDIPNNTAGVGIEHKFGKDDLGTMYSDKYTSGTFRFNCTEGATPEMAAQPCVVTTQKNPHNQTDPEMQQIARTAAKNYNPQTPQNTTPQYNQHTTYQEPAVIGALRLGVAIIAISGVGNGGNNQPSGGSTGGGSKTRTPTGNTPAPTRNPDKPVNY